MISIPSENIGTFPQAAKEAGQMDAAPVH